MTDLRNREPTELEQAWIEFVHVVGTEIRIYEMLDWLTCLIERNPFLGQITPARAVFAFMFIIAIGAVIGRVLP